MSPPPWQEIQCGMPGCGRDADVVCSSLDGAAGGIGMTMAFCVRDFWRWNAASLRRRGLSGAAAVLETQIEAGLLDHLPPSFVAREFTGFQVAGDARRRQAD